MKSFFALAALATSVFAQNLVIKSPAAGSTVSASQPLFVDLQQVLGSGILDQIGLIISLKGDDSSSTDPITGYSTILYNGTFNPQPDFANPQNGFHENFTLAVPENYVVTGPATLTVLHFLATDAALTPEVEIVDTQFNLQ